MPRAKLDLDQLKTAKFLGASRDLLDRAHTTLLGYDPDKTDTDEQVREACCKAAGVSVGGVAPVAVLPAHLDVSLPVKGQAGRIPNLRASGSWEGKKRRVVLHWKGDSSQNVKAVKIGWEGVTWAVKMGDVVDMPYPFWHSAVNAVKHQFKKTFSNDRDGNLQAETEKWEEPIFMINDLGVTPGTEDLPEDYMDYFQTEARKNELFKSFKRPMLIRILNLINGEMPASVFDNKDETMLRMMIARGLGPEFDNMINNELYEAA